jgi:hypothetical protein
MGRVVLVLASVLLLLGSQICCCAFLPGVPDIQLPEIETRPFEPRLEVGPTRDYEEEIPLEDAEEARVRVRFGAGEISLAAGDPDMLFSGQFRTNVAEWAPEVTWQDGLLEIEQGRSSGIPESGMRNEWDLEFSPGAVLDMELEIGASDGDLDFTGLALEIVRFDEPNLARMERLDIEAGAASLRVDGIGNAGPERATVTGGLGDLTLDFGGDWPGSSRVDVEAGVGSFTLFLPEDVGVRVEIEGALSNVQADAGLSRSGGAYVNDAYGETETELLITITVGLGSIDLQLAGG